MRRFTFPMLALILVLGQTSAKAGPDAIKVGVLNDLSGVYADLGGPGSVTAAEIAIEDVGKRHLSIRSMRVTMAPSNGRSITRLPRGERPRGRRGRQSGPAAVHDAFEVAR